LLTELLTDWYARLVAELDIDAMLKRFRERALAVKKRPLPPVAGEERMQFIEQSQKDFQDFAMLADAEGELVDGVLTLRIDLRPAQPD
jgi:hypothetical protein